MVFEVRFDDRGAVRRPRLTPPPRDAHKYARGAALVFSGPALATGASRLAAEAAIRIGAGLVTIVGERPALTEHSAHLTAIMLREEGEGDPLADPRTRAALIGPGAGEGEAVRTRVERILSRRCAAVLDADAITAFADDPARLFAGLHPACVLTPHEGEFARLFGEVDPANRAPATAAAAKRAGCVVLLKGARTEIAAVDGRQAHNDHGASWLATAGSGDTLGGMILGMLAQQVDPFDAAAMAAWLHGEAGIRGGPGLIADDLAGLLPEIMAELVEMR